jgi:hypothetical protein
MQFSSADTCFLILYGNAGRGGAAACVSRVNRIEWCEDEGCRFPDSEVPCFCIGKFSGDGRMLAAFVTDETAAAFIEAAS